MKQQGNILIILGIIVALAAGLIIYYNYNKPTTQDQFSPTPQPTTTSSNGEQTKTYQSKDMKLTITIPEKFTIQDQSIRIILRNDEGEIVISRAGTQFSELDSYLKDLDSQNKVKVISQKDINIDGYQAKLRTIMYLGESNEERSYKILVETRVYTFSTSSESLFEDLDQIAQSFKYTP